MEERRDDGATVVVQIPRDNVCRVPPSDHASIVREHSRTSSNPKSRRFHISQSIPFIFVFVLLLLMSILAVRATVYRPTPPQFTVTRIQQSNGSPLSPDVSVGVHAESRSPRMSVSYLGGGSAALLFDGKEIMRGKIPEPVKDGKEGAADFAVGLGVKLASMSSEIIKKLDDDGDKEKLIELVLELPMEMKSWLRHERMDMKIDCDIWVKHSLLKHANISFQDCQTEFLKKL